MTLIDVSNYPNGIYFVSIISNDKRLTKKLVVKN
ncbi:MAG: T9SS type A sorting domain-containing protein [Flavobacteriales bacterium]|nr:T9SS type A sorting domain-containing protein [Flavobacteriales bacterium]